MALLSYFTYAQSANALMLSIIIYILVQTSTIGALHWIYLPEILTDAQFAFVSSIYYLNGVEIALCSEEMIHHLHPDGVFFFYFIISALGLIWMYTYLKDTAGLSAHQKKELYMPIGYRTKQEAYQLGNDGVF